MKIFSSYRLFCNAPLEKLATSRFHFSISRRIDNFLYDFSSSTAIRVRSMITAVEASYGLVLESTFHIITAIAGVSVPVHFSLIRRYTICPPCWTSSERICCCQKCQCDDLEQILQSTRTTLLFIEMKNNQNGNTASLTQNVLQVTEFFSKRRHQCRGEISPGPKFLRRRYSKSHHHFRLHLAYYHRRITLRCLLCTVRLR